MLICEKLKVEKKINQKGMTLVPLNIHTNETGLIKMKIGLAKGKKLYDKREDMKKRTIEKALQRTLKVHKK